MGKWQPPIPSGALWCKPMRALGPAKAIIEYCYDLVERDGWCKFKLIEMADDMDEPYINVKRWWHAIEGANETLGIFAEIRKRGVKGIEARFSDNWIDWRILTSRAESTGPKRTEEVSEEVSTLLPLSRNDTEEVSEEVAKLIPLSHTYGTHDSNFAESPPPPKTQPPRVAGGGGAADPLLSKLRSLFSQLGITNAARLAAHYRSEYPQVTLDQVAAYVDTIASDCEKDPAERGSRYYRKLENGIPKAWVKARAPTPIPQPTRPSVAPDALSPQEVGALAMRLKAELDKKKREAAHAA